MKYLVFYVCPSPSILPPRGSLLLTCAKYWISCSSLSITLLGGPGAISGHGSNSFTIFYKYETSSFFFFKVKNQLFLKILTCKEKLRIYTTIATKLNGKF